MTMLVIIFMIIFRERKKNRISMEVTSSIEIKTPANFEAKTKPDNNSDWDQYMNNIPGSPRNFLSPTNLLSGKQIAPRNSSTTKLLDVSSSQAELEIPGCDRSNSFIKRRIDNRFYSSFIQYSSQRFGSPINSPRTPVVCSTKVLSKFNIQSESKIYQAEEPSILENKSEIYIKTGTTKPIIKKERKKQTLSQIIYVCIYLINIYRNLMHFYLQ